ncbi:MAG TPA: helix-turn-helix transcriptional regulator [Candidatus Saccharibacteria bacterium]|nr:helix-turn-helix transcriptional regulator [Candidatus Saccharibacteria bacterium]
MQPNIDLNDDEFQFLLSWEEVYKKGALTYRVLLLLNEERYDAAQLYMRLQENDTSLNEHSLYRLLRRLYDVGVIDIAGKLGRNKYYQISEKGARVLTVFTTRNIAPYAKLYNKENV